jgi:hypothetical protein
MPVDLEEYLQAAADLVSFECSLQAGEDSREGRQSGAGEHPCGNAASPTAFQL